MRKKKKAKYVPRSHAEIEHEMVQRGIELTKMIKIFTMVRDLLPEGPAEQIEKIARKYARRNDDDRGSVTRPGEIDFQDEGIRLKRNNIRHHTVRLKPGKGEGIYPMHPKKRH